MAFDIEGAKKAGASDEAIASHLSKKYGFDIVNAQKAGASASSIIEHLMKKEAPKVTEPTPRPSEQPPVAKQPVGIIERMFGAASPTARVLKGAVVDPLLNLNRMVADTGVLGDTVKQGATQLAQGYEGATQEARQRIDSTGFDPFQLIGAVVSPINKIGVAGQGANLATKVGMGAGAGAVQGVLSSTKETGDEAASDRLVNAAIGSVLGGAIPAGLEGIKAFVNLLKNIPISQAAKERAVQKYIGDKVPEESRAKIIETLRTTTPATEGRQLTVTESLADTPQAIPLMREQERVFKQVPDLSRIRELENQQTNQQAMEGAFGKKGDIEVATDFRDIITSEMRSKALQDADRFGNAVVPLERGISEGKPGWLSNATNAVENRKAASEVRDITKRQAADVQLKKNQLDTLKEEGFYPLEVTSIISKIDELANQPGSRSNSLLTSSIQSLRGKLERLTDSESGIIKSDDLYNVRKEIAQDMKAFLSPSNTQFGAAAAKDEKKLKVILDNAINKASGGDLWTKYISEFADRSKQIDRMKVGREFLNKLGAGNANNAQKAANFVESVDKATDVIKSVTGRQYNKLEDFATDRQVNVLKSISSDLARAERATLASSKGVASKGIESEANVIPGLISTPIAVTKSIINTLQRGSQKEFDKTVANLMLNPQQMVSFIEGLSNNRRDTVVELFIQRMSPSVRKDFVQFVTESSKSTASALITRNAPTAGSIEILEQARNN